MTTPEQTGCAGGCGKKVPDPQAAGWQFLEVTKRYRCWACTRELDAVNGRNRDLEDAEGT